MILKNLKENTGILIRFDDIAPNMNWEMMEKCEKLLNQYSIKPVLGVIPKNEDKELLIYPKRDDFWKKVKDWKSNKWSIAMHGYNHVYEKDTKKKDYFNHGGKSEFFGQAYEIQLNKLKNGLQIFRENDIKIDTFFAPNHTYDLNTFEALKAVGIFKVIDGCGLLPYSSNDIKFVPQLFYKLIFLPYGIQSTQIHVNYWKDKDYEIFENFINNNYKKIINLEYAFSKFNDSLFNNILNFLVRNTLRLKRSIF